MQQAAEVQPEAAQTAQSEEKPEEGSKPMNYKELREVRLRARKSAVEGEQICNSSEKWEKFINEWPEKREQLTTDSKQRLDKSKEKHIARLFQARGPTPPLHVKDIKKRQLSPKSSTARLPPALTLLGKRAAPQPVPITPVVKKTLLTITPTTDKAVVRKQKVTIPKPNFLQPKKPQPQIAKSAPKAGKPASAVAKGRNPGGK